MAKFQKREICKNCGTEITNRPHYLAYLVETGGVEKVCSLCRVRLRGHKKRPLAARTTKGGPHVDINIIAQKRRQKHDIH